MKDERARDVRATYQDRFLPAKDQNWLNSYLAAVREARTIPEDQFRAPSFQQRLWEMEGVAGIGPGSSVTVPGAYDDFEVVDAFWRLRIWEGPEDPLARAHALDAEFDRILGIVSPRHNARRPAARLVRIFAILRPDDVLCLLDRNRTRRFRQWLEEPSYKLGVIGQHAISRRALRDVLGPEANDEDRVLYSLYSWFVWSQILGPADAVTEAGQTDVESRATDAPRLAVLPAKAQRKGINYLSNNLDLLLSMVRAAENGIDRSALDQQIAEEAPSLKSTSRANLLAQAPALGLLAFENGAYRATDLGRALLEGEPASDVLTPILVRSVFGFAQILDDLTREKTLERGQIAERCKGYYPRWQSDFAPNQLVAWMRDLGLITIAGVGISAKISLTEAGEYWASGLPSDMKAAERLLGDQLPDDVPELDEDVEEASPAIAQRLQAPPLEAILARFRGSDYLKSLVFSETQIGLIHAALHSTAGKRFVLLAGLSGTGKTSMAQGYARAYCEALGLPHQGHYEQVAVWPDWTDPTGLLGFVNPLATPPRPSTKLALCVCC